MPYAKEPFRWGTFIVNASAIGLAVYLYEVHGVNVYFWLAWLFGLEPGWWGALAGLLFSVLLLLGLVTAFTLLLRLKWYRTRFRHRTKMGKARDWAFGVPAFYLLFGCLASILVLGSRILG